MIAKVTKGKSFAALTRYLEAGRDGGDDPHRVAWTESRNLATNDPESAGQHMQTTAAQSKRVQKPVYHVALSFDPEDTVDRATMLRVADRLRSDLGIQEHQALIMAHDDTRHAHLHMVVNRVHPERARAWDPKHDYARIERSLRVQERELGLKAVRGRHYRLDGREQPKRTEAHAMDGEHQQQKERTPTEPAPGANEAKEGRTTGRNAGEGVERSRSPERDRDLTRARADERAAPVHGRGDPPAERAPNDQRAPAPEPSATDIAAARARVEAFTREVIRDIHEATSREDLTRRMIEKGLWGQEGTRPGSPAERNYQDLQRLGGHHVVDADRQPRAEWYSSGSTADAAKSGRSAAAEADVESPQNPKAQRSAGDQATRAPGREPANPDRGGTASPGSTRDAPASSRSHGMDGARPEGARADPGNSGRTSSDALDPRLEGVRRTITRLERRIELDRTRDTTRDELDRAQMRLLPYTAQRAEARQASARFRTALAEVYRDPTAARRAFHTRAAQAGAPGASAEMARHPGRFGEPRGTQVGPIRSAERAAALRAAPKLETLATEHVRRVREAWSHRAEYRQERATVTRLERQLKTINHELGRSPRRADLEQRLGRQLQRLERPHLKALHRALPLPQQRIVAGAVRIGRAFAHEQGHER